MKEMVYKSERCDAELLACDTYKGFDYYVVSRGMHPCAYVDIKHYDKAINAKTINCHGGITYSESTLDAADHDGWFIGWGYAQVLDYFGCYRDAPDTRTYRRWTTAEMVAECKRVIDQICERRSDADVAPVVRCKDCKYSTLPSMQTQIYGKPGTLTCHNRKSPCNRRNVTSDDYCSYADRKDDNAT